MDGIASSNEKVQMNYFLTTCIRAEKADCLAVLREYAKSGYTYVTTFEDGENVLIIYKKPKIILSQNSGL